METGIGQSKYRILKPFHVVWSVLAVVLFDFHLYFYWFWLITMLFDPTLSKFDRSRFLQWLLNLNWLHYIFLICENNCRSISCFALIFSSTINSVLRKLTKLLSTLNDSFIFFPWPPIDSFLKLCDIVLLLLIIALLSAMVSAVCYRIRDKSPLRVDQERNAVFNQSTLSVLNGERNREQ